MLFNFIDFIDNKYCFLKNDTKSVYIKDHNSGTRGSNILKTLNPFTSKAYATIKLIKAYIIATPGTFKFNPVNVVKRYPIA